MSEVMVWNGNVDQSERFNVFQFDQLVCFHFDWIKYCLWIYSCVLYSFMTFPFDVDYLMFSFIFFDVFFLLIIFFRFVICFWFFSIIFLFSLRSDYTDHFSFKIPHIFCNVDTSFNFYLFMIIRNIILL